MILGIKHLGVEAIPPLALSVGGSKTPVVGDSDLVAVAVVTACGFIEYPGVVGMQAYTKFKTMLVASVGPPCEKIFFRTDCSRVPGLILAVPQVEIVVMVAESEKVLSSKLLIETDNAIGVPTLGLE